MAKLVIKSEGFHNRVLDLRLGTNRLGRSPTNDFVIEHPTVSALHCELELAESGVTVRDCDSTNGTFVAERPVKQASLWPGQILRVGDVELLVESTDVVIAIPELKPERPPPPTLNADGLLVCARHKTTVTHQCTHCRLMLCDECVHRLRRRGGKMLRLCPECSHACEPLFKGPAKKKTLMAFLAKTVKMAFLGHRQDDEA